MDGPRISVVIMVVSVNKHMWQVYRNITVIVQSIIFVTIYNFLPVLCRYFYYYSAKHAVLLVKPVKRVL